MKHIFAISAYGQSPYLEECIASLEKQTVKSPVIICTSTPSLYLERLSAEHGIQLFVRDGAPGLADDWNYAVQKAAESGAGIVTIAHQDDIYLPDYSLFVTRAAENGAPLIIFTAAGNIDGLGRAFGGRAEKIKRMLRWPLLTPLKHTKFGKRLSLAYGNSVPCPSVTYNLSQTGRPLFESGLSFAADWDAMMRLSHRKGSFKYIKEPLVNIRIHKGAQTFKTMGESRREKEELEMLKKFHCAPVAALIMHFYKGAAKSYGK